MKAKWQYICRVLVVLFCFSIWLSNSAVAAESITWHAYDEGMSLGRIEKKKVFLHFYANWCFFCRKMVKETFQVFENKLGPNKVDYILGIEKTIETIRKGHRDFS